MDEAYDIYEFGNNSRILIPRYLSSGDSLEGDDIQSDPDELPGEPNEIEEGEPDRNDCYDYSNDFSAINSSLDSLSLQVDNLNNNIVVFQEDQKIIAGFLFAICVYLVIKIGFSIFNKILGLGQV